MADTKSKLADAYQLVMAAEREAVSNVKEAAEVFLAAIQAELDKLPPQSSPQSSGIANLNSWRNTIQSIASNTNQVLAQYPVASD